MITVSTLLATATLFLWKGETQYVWRDFTVDATFDSWVCKWRAGGTFLHYPESPSLRWLGLKNGLNLSEKVFRLRMEGRVDVRLQAALDEFVGAKGRFPSPEAVADLLARTAREVQRAACD